MPRKTDKYVRITLTVTPELYDRMVNELADVNWSAIASAAFRDRLDGNQELEIREELAELKRRLLSLEAKVKGK